ncbi:MAG TPA: methyltransferase domain-containing protein [Rhizomicrobium sp.]|nr:methyltransferase domain-containing protein [Rhizomicrobium sp.]
MNPAFLDFLRCPKTGAKLECVDGEFVQGRIRRGLLRVPGAPHAYPIIDFIPRFVQNENYAENFGLEWNIHSRTQYDAASGHDTSHRRFVEETRWPHDLRGEIILEIGSGSGRFTEHALATGATVVSFDFSRAVEANYCSNGHHDNLLLVQASIFEMPFPRDCFDRAFCFGVLQHTPDPKAAFIHVIDFLKPDGQIAADIYIKNFYRWVLPFKYWVRPFTKGRPPEKLYRYITRYVDFMWPLARTLRRIPRVGSPLNWKLLIGDYSRELPHADEATLKQWAYLDTFDMLSPAYDFPQTVGTFRRWFCEAGYTDIDVHEGYNGVEGRGRKPAIASAPHSLAA